MAIYEVRNIKGYIVATTECANRAYAYYCYWNDVAGYAEIWYKDECILRTRQED